MHDRPYERVLLIEFNELVPHLMERWIADGSLPNFKALRDRSVQFVSQADVASPAELEPWIQWYSIHTGLSYDQHGVFHLTDGPRAKHRDVFDILGDAGKKLGCFGSMNVKGFPADRGFFVADPWCDGQSAQPAELNVFQKFVSQYVREYSNPSADARPVSSAQFLSFMAGHGLSARTVSQTLAQLTQERVKDKAWSWQRAAILDRLCIDVFKHLYRRHRPDFATFFSNSTAHLQHSYWRHMDPHAFKVQPSKEQRDIYGGAIKYGYVMMDRLIREIVSLTGPRDLVIFATALSQQPFLRKEDAGGQLFYRPRDVSTLFDRLGVAGAKIEPVMTHQFRLRFDNEEARANAVRILGGVRCEGNVLAGISDHAADGFVFGCCISKQLPPDALVSREGSNETLRFFDLFYQIDGMKSGCHHPDGILWFATGTPADGGRCSILDILPTILDAMGRPDLLPAECRGRALILPGEQRRAA
jgi:Type I phosphodiesterase / nucleotide pyrophosphatase